MAKVLVTGGAGFIGSHLAAGLVGAGHRVRVLDNFTSGKRENLTAVGRQAEVVEGDIRSAEVCRAACRGMEMVFHQAALVSVPRSVENPRESHDVNLEGTLNVLLAAKTEGCRRVIYASSSSVYGNSAESPKRETQPPAPLSPYAVQKLGGEMYCRAFHECYGMETLALRYFNVFGPRQDPAGAYAAAVPAFVQSVLAGRAPVVYGDGEQTRDFTYVENVVQANLRAMEIKQTRGEVVNVACGEGITINEVLRCIGRVLGKAITPRYEPARTGDVRHSTADIGRARTLLGYTPRIGFEEGLRRAIDSYRK